MATEKKEAFYVGINDPQEFRREVLSSCKTAIILLKKFEIQREVYKSKSDQMSQLNKTLKEIGFLVNKINTLIPDHKLRELPSKPKKEPPKKAKKKEPEEKKPEKPKASKRHISELEKLEKELEQIEKRMTSVSR